MDNLKLGEILIDGFSRSFTLLSLDKALLILSDLLVDNDKSATLS